MKKILLGVIVIIMSFILVGCSNLKTVEGNKSFGKYTGIYKLGNNEISMVQLKEKILVLFYKDKELCGNTTWFVENNKVDDSEYKVEFKNNALKITSDNQALANGEYKRVKPYTTKEIYKDYIGDISLLKDNSGKYESDNKTMYIIKTNEDTVKFATYHNEMIMNIELNKDKDNSFKSDLFEEKYYMNINGNSFDLVVDTNDEDLKKLSGKYTKTADIKIEDVIKIFAFDEIK